MSHKQMVVCIIDDDPGVRDSLALLLGLHGLGVQTYSDASTFLASEHRFASSCALIDIRMCDMGGLELQQTLVKRGKALPIIVMTGHPNVATARTAFKAGAIDYLVKPISEADLLSAIEQALAAGAPAHQQPLPEPAMLQINRLTQRERQILVLLMDGLTSREIAERLSISPRTVETYKGRMMEKLKLRKLSELIRVGVLALPQQGLS